MGEGPGVRGQRASGCWSGAAGGFPWSREAPARPLRSVVVGGALISGSRVVLEGPCGPDGRGKIHQAEKQERRFRETEQDEGGKETDDRRADGYRPADEVAQ